MKYETLGAAVEALDTASKITNPAHRERDVEVVKVGMLIDIAASLRAIAYGLTVDEAPGGDDGLLLPPEAGDDDAATEAETGEGKSIPAERPIEVGDWVAHESNPALNPCRVTAMGESEGEAWLKLELPNGAISTPLWAQFYRRVDAPAAVDESHDHELADLTDDIDSDFGTTPEPVKAKGKGKRKAAKQ